MKLKMKHFTPAIVLGTICLIVAALLATINIFTAPVIAENEREARSASLREVFKKEDGKDSGAEFGDAMKNLTLAEGSSVVEVYEEKNGMGYAVTLSVQGYVDKIKITVGVSKDEKVVGVIITDSKETKDSNGKITISKFLEMFKGKSDAEEVDLIAGVTISSRAIRKAVDDALNVVKSINKGKTVSASLMSQEDTQGKSARVVEPLQKEAVISLAKEMLAGAEDFEFIKTVSPEAEKEGNFAGYVPYKAHLYKETSGKGFAVYAESYNQYSFTWGPDANAVFVLDKSFTITDFKLIGWSLSPTYDVPVKDSEHPNVKSFEKSFVGVNLMNYTTKVDLVTKATETSVRLEDASLAALEYFDEFHATEIKIYKGVGIAVLIIGIAGIGVGIYFQRRRRK